MTDLEWSRRRLNNLCVEAENGLSYVDKQRLVAFLRWWADELDKQAWLEAIDDENDRSERRPPGR